MPLRTSAPRRLEGNAAVCIYRPLSDSECLPCTHSTASQSTRPWICRDSQSGAFLGFGAPRGVAFLHNASDSAAALNAELGIDHVRLPVTHTHTVADASQVGLWLYYARGCSDASWPIGRTMLVRNRCDAAITVHQRINSRGNGLRSWQNALSQVASSLASASSRLALKGLHHIRDTNHSTLLAALADCARGDFSSSSQGLPLFLAKHNALDFVTALMLRELRGTARQLDTLQLYRQPQGGLETGQYATEIWDVRSLQARSLGTPPPPADRPRLGWLDGSECRLSPTWASCLACAGSKLERACRFRCTQFRPKKSPPAQLVTEDPKCGLPFQMLSSYGGLLMSPDVRRRLIELGPAGISVAWLRSPCDDPDPFVRCNGCTNVKQHRMLDPSALTVWIEQIASIERGDSFGGFAARFDEDAERRRARWTREHCAVVSWKSACATTWSTYKRYRGARQ